MRKNKLTKMIAVMLVTVTCLSFATPTFAVGSIAKKNDSIFTQLETADNTDKNDANETANNGDTSSENAGVNRVNTLAVGEPIAEENEYKNFPVTLYNYDEAYNRAMHQKEVDIATASGNALTSWSGMYFGESLTKATFDYTVPVETYNKMKCIFDNAGNAIFEDGEYLISISDSATFMTNEIEQYKLTFLSPKRDGFKPTTDKNNENAVWSFEKVGNDGSYFIKDKDGKYLAVTSYGVKLNTQPSTIRIRKAGNNYYFYDAESNRKLDYSADHFHGTGWVDNWIKYPQFVLYAQKEERTTANLPYADWNKWTGADDMKNKVNEVVGEKFASGSPFSGLVEDKLQGGNIAFNHDRTFDAGIFDNDGKIKDIYTNVGMPFKILEDGYYEFDSNKTSAYFEDGVASSNANLKYESVPQYAYHNRSYTAGWYPFNGVNYNSNQNKNVLSGSTDYYFGMRATFPFSMSNDGRTEDGEPIKFEFSGDDDVWVFVDGTLVLDIGGIHGAVEANIDFANNTWSVLAKNDKGALSTNPYYAGTLFNEGEETGTLDVSRDTFSFTENHELTVFYLERGAGDSNCKIKFNLPVKDYLSVTKVATTKEVIEIDDNGKEQPAEIMPLSVAEQRIVDNINFKFTLYKNDETVANRTYSLMDANGHAIATLRTNANGEFNLKNGQTAKFTGFIGTDERYYVVESKESGFKNPSYTCEYPHDGTNNTDTTSDSWTSNVITATGSEKIGDSVVFTCRNVMIGGTASMRDDTIVVDYGLPVTIDALANDIYSSGDAKLVSVSGAKYGTATVKDNKVEYNLTKQLNGIEKLTYTVTYNLTTETKSANIYIIPATSMYYEENFSNMITYTGAWETVGTSYNRHQESGVVGNVSYNSPYGSDRAYLADGGDSHGTSKYAYTANGSAGFSYSFTGTGTTFFARTANDSGYMRVQVFDKDNALVYTGFRDTAYKLAKDEDGNLTGATSAMLYNIPIFSWNTENYGTYTVKVAIAKVDDGMDIGNKFWLDGVRVLEPMNPNDSDVSMANSAYDADGESNMACVTLRDKLITEYTSKGEEGAEWDEDHVFYLYTDDGNDGSEGTSSAEEFINQGPKEEVYMKAGQRVEFALADWDPNTNKLFIGIKAPNGGGQVKINGVLVDINNSTDCYYEISNVKEIISDGMVAKFEIEVVDSVISITNIKVSGEYKFAIIPGKDEAMPETDND